MVIYKKIVIHLDKARDRIDSNNSIPEKKKDHLHELYDIFERGEWSRCYGFIIRHFSKEEINWINPEVYRVIRNYANQLEVYILDPKEK